MYVFPIIQHWFLPAAVAAAADADVGCIFTRVDVGDSLPQSKSYKRWWFCFWRKKDTL